MPIGVALLLILSATSLAADSTVRTLLPGERVEARIVNGEVHSYRVDAAAGEFVRIRLEGHGALLRLSGDGVLRERAAGEFAPLTWSRVASATAYELRVESRDSEPRPYIILLLERRPAAPADGVRVSAEDALARADIEDGQGAAHAQAALELYRESERLFASAGDKHGQAEAFIRRGQVLATLGQSKEALETWGLAASLVRDLRDEAGEATVLFRQGRLHASTGQPAKAQEALDRSLAIREKRGDLAGQAETLVELAGVAGVRSESDRALALLDRAVGLARSANDRRGTADALNQAGVLNAYLGRTGLALNLYREALAIRERIRLLDGQGQTLNNLGVLHVNLGETRTAIGHYERAVELRQAAGNRQGAQTPLYNLGVAHAELGEHDRAISLFREAASGFHETGGRRGEAFSLQALGDSLLALGDAERAGEHYEQALTSWRAIGDRRGEALALTKQAAIYQGTNRTSKARESLDRAISLSRELGYQRELSQALVKLADIQRAGGDSASAEISLHEALRIGRAIADPRAEAAALTGLGDLAFDSTSDSDAARKAAGFYREALVLREASGDRPSEARLHARLARAGRRTGDLAEARRNVLVTLELVESMRAGLSNDDLRISYAASSRSHYQLAIDILMDSHAREPGRGFDAEAFHISERARARSLLEMLAAGRIEVREGVDAKLLSEEREIQDLVNSKAARLTRLLAASHTADQAEAARREVRDLLTRQSELRGRIRVSHPRYAALTHPVPITAGEARQKLLDDRTVLLEYWLGEERSILWTLSKDATRTSLLPSRAQIEKLVDQAAASLAEAGRIVNGETAAARRVRLSQSEARFRSDANELSTMLLAPAAADLPGRRLWIVADGALARLPFAALPLAEHSAIASQPSASVLALLRQEALSGSPLSSAAILADPVYSASDSRVRGGSTGGPVATEYPRLRFSRQEAQQIATLQARPPLLALDFDASRQAVLSRALADRAIVHFATHALINDRHPELSGIVLSLVDPAGKPVDGFLRLHEIYNLDLHARLVVLSACRSALGRQVEGEGLIGLARGFLHAGSAAVLASLWNVDDRATAAFMGHFYGALLKQRLDPAAALEAARRKMQSQERWRHPYYWSTFVLIGDSR